MELDDKIRNLITACFGINAETIRHATPEWLSKMVSSCDTDVIRNADNESIMELIRSLEDAGIVIYVVDCHAVDFPEGLPFETYIRKCDRFTDVYVPNPAQDYGTKARFFFPDPREGRCEALKHAAAMFIHPDENVVIKMKYEFIANGIEVNIREQKKRLLGIIRNDVGRDPGLFGGRICLSEKDGCLYVKNDSGRGTLKLDDMSLDGILFHIR